MIRPFASRTVRVTQTSLPSTGHSMRFRSPRGRLEVYWTVSYLRTTLRTVGADHVVVRPLGRLQIWKVTMPGEANDLMRIGWLVSLRKRIDCEPDTVASRPSG